MERFGLKSMRMTVMAFGDKAFEVYFISFGGKLWGIIPEYEVAAFGSFETHVVQRLREVMVEKGVCNPADEPNFSPSVLEDKPQKAARSKAKDDKPSLF